MSEILPFVIHPFVLNITFFVELFLKYPKSRKVNKISPWFNQLMFIEPLL